METNYHIPVLLNESIEGLAIASTGIYVDATYGGGGHSRKILEQLGNGTLIAFDQDVDARYNIIDDQRLIFVHQNFRFLKNFLRYHGFEQVDGVLADLGVSSHDFDVPDRGFSFRFEGRLDMRMNQTALKTAEQVINEYEEKDLEMIFRDYGELSNARKTASVIVESRQRNPIRTTQELCSVLEPLVPQKAANKYLAKVFQALRIEVNQELDVLKSFLNDVVDVLKPGGRLVVISYHSLEDRLVKNLIQKGGFSGEAEKDFYGNVQAKFRPVCKKAIVPSEEEVRINPRARSAKLRIAEKI
ncbi:MAG TPA: 16S rRNA (cytosine(1402)-N(4))-methyltransferase RsmH [Prolixibacteraceae bacterium]|nr:16S rRNA (cytosine(1402)-N(4))-methyltransferase RsmH [Prolixibacteraceae bacterium]HPS12608.1 16S rRNA (cytosine(1402)-N(4))-methyltransferase RsmH [Prolixibacteraceae bacterium]